MTSGTSHALSAPPRDPAPTRQTPGLRADEDRQARPATDLSALPLPALRAYRQLLVAEESRVSYWRRILQARLDLLRADPHLPARWEMVLCHANVVSRRASLALLPVDDVPPLPELAPLWDMPAEGSRQPRVAALLSRLVEAERALSAYRCALHLRLDQATEELVARYSEDPRRCLGALPRGPR